MQIVTITQARKQLAKIIDNVKYYNRPIGIGRRKKIDVLLIKFPDDFNEYLGETTNMNQYGGSFDFLAVTNRIFIAWLI